MALKLGPSLLFAAGVALAFLGGSIAPEPVGESVRGAVAAVKKQLAPAAAASTPVHQSAVPAPAAGASAPAAAASARVPLGATLLPTLMPGTGTYALQAGQFASQQSAEQLSASINGQGVTSSVIPATDERGTSWAVVSVGRFSSPEMALSQRSYLSNKLGLPQYLVPIAVPPPKPSP